MNFVPLLPGPAPRARKGVAATRSRRVVTMADPQTLERGREPLHTLADYRRWPDGGVMFGQNVIHASPGGTLRVGDEVVLEA